MTGLNAQWFINLYEKVKKQKEEIYKQWAAEDIHTRAPFIEKEVFKEILHIEEMRKLYNSCREINLLSHAPQVQVQDSK